jgi:hypothetical protein
MYFRLAAQLFSCCLSGLCHLIQYRRKVHTLFSDCLNECCRISEARGVYVYVLLQRPESRLDTFLSETLVLMQAHV